MHFEKKIGAKNLNFKEMNQSIFKKKKNQNRHKKKEKSLIISLSIKRKYNPIIRKYVTSFK